MANLLTISPEITMRELLEICPGAQRALFRNYHIGGCASCGFQPDETLAQVCARNNGLPVEEVIEQLQKGHEADSKVLIEPMEVARMRSRGEAYRLLDIRTREEFDAVHIEGSLLFTQDLMQEALMRWDRGEMIVIVDHLGARSLDAAAYFTGHGFENIRALHGGIDAWSREVDSALPRYHLE